MVDLCLCWRVISPSLFVKKEPGLLFVGKYPSTLGSCLEHDFDYVADTRVLHREETGKKPKKLKKMLCSILKNIVKILRPKSLKKQNTEHAAMLA